MSRSNIGKLELQKQRLEREKEKALRRISQLKTRAAQLVMSISFLDEEIEKGASHAL